MKDAMTWQQIMEELNDQREWFNSLIGRDRWEIRSSSILITWWEGTKEVCIYHCCNKRTNFSDCETWKEVFEKTIIDIKSKRS